MLEDEFALEMSVFAFVGRQSDFGFSSNKESCHWSMHDSTIRLSQSISAPSPARETRRPTHCQARKL